MIARIVGRLEEVASDRVLVETPSGLWYEVLVPHSDLDKLTRLLGRPVTLHTIHYVEGDPTRGSLTPRLVGFLAEQDRQFFRVFTTVKGVGVRKALRALVRPAGEVATAIQNKDVKLLKALPEIGPKMAERICAELHDKVADFSAGVQAAEVAEMSAAAQEAILVLVQLGERRADAAALVQRVMDVAPETISPEEIIQKVYRLKAGAAQ